MEYTLHYTFNSRYTKIIYLPYNIDLDVVTHSYIVFLNLEVGTLRIESLRQSSEEMISLVQQCIVSTPTS